MTGEWQPIETAPIDEVIFCRDADLWVQPMILCQSRASFEKGRWPWSRPKPVSAHRYWCYAIPDDSGVCHRLVMRPDQPWTPTQWAWPFFDEPSTSGAAP